MSAPAVGKSQGIHIELGNGESSIRLSLHLGEEYTGGNLIRLSPDATFAIESADELSSSYGQANWESGLASGAFYAYRTLQSLRRVVYVSEFTGRLRSADMDAVAAGATYAVTRCLYPIALPLDLEGWQVKSLEVSENGTKPVSSIMG